MPTRSRTRRLAALTGVTALALTGVASSSADAAEKTLTYDCKALESINVGTWAVTLTMDLPATVKAGSTMKAPKVSAKVTTSTQAADLLRNVLKAERISGTSSVAYKIDDTAFRAKLSLPETPVPAAGPINVAATGTGQEAEAPNAPTTSTVTAGDFTIKLAVIRYGQKQPVSVACTLPAGTDATIGTIKVVAGDPTPTETETEDPTSTSTSSTSTSSTTTGSSSPSSSASSSEGSTSVPADPTSSSDAPMGPKVDTGVVGDGANGETIALGLLTIGGIAAAGLASRRRLNR